MRSLLSSSGGPKRVTLTDSILKLSERQSAMSVLALERNGLSTILARASPSARRIPFLRQPRMSNYLTVVRTNRHRLSSSDPSHQTTQPTYQLPELFLTSNRPAGIGTRSPLSLSSRLPRQ